MKKSVDKNVNRGIVKIQELNTSTKQRGRMKFLPDGSLRPLDKSNIKETLGRCKKAELNEKFDLGFSEKELTKTRKETLVQIASEIRINKWEEGLKEDILMRRDLDLTCKSKGAENELSKILVCLL